MYLPITDFAALDRRRWVVRIQLQACAAKFFWMIMQEV